MYAAFVDYKKAVNKAKKNKLTAPRIPDFIGECFLLIANNLAKRPNFSGYMYKDEMVSDGIENCIMYLNNFNPNKYRNPFAYFTQIIYFAFVRRIDKEKKQLYIKHKYMENQMVDNTLFDHTDDAPYMIPGYIDMDNEKMKHLVIDFEKKLKKKKRMLKKRGLEKALLEED